MISCNDYLSKFGEDSGFQSDMATTILCSLEENCSSEMLQSALLSTTNDPQIAEVTANNIIEVAAEVANFFGREEAEAFLSQMLTKTQAGMSVNELNNEINKFFASLAS